MAAKEGSSAGVLYSASRVQKQIRMAFSPETPASPPLRRALLAILMCAALVSLAAGIRHAIEFKSRDLQWEGSRLLAHHIDPWQEKLANYPHHFAHFSPPNYLHLLYLLLLPLSLLSFVPAEILWCIASIGFSMAAVLLLRRIFSLSRSQTILVLSLLWMSSPFRVVLECGQISLFELFFFCLVYAAVSSWLAGLALGVSLIKYSFSPPAVLLLLFRRRVRILSVAAALTCLALLGVWLLVATPLPRLAVEPLLVSRVAVNPGVADLMTFSEFALKARMQADHARAISYAFALGGSGLYAALLSRFRLSARTELTLVSLAGLLFFKHLIYDYVFLVIPLAYALSHKNARVRYPIVAGVLVFWFLAAIVNGASSDFTVDMPRLTVNFLFFVALVAYTTYAAIRSEPAASL